MSGMFAVTAPAELWSVLNDAVALKDLRLTRVETSPAQTPRYLLGVNLVDHRPPEDTVLTEREMQILVRVAQGMSNSQIGKAMFLSGDTVKTYNRRLFRKLGARDRAHAVHIAHTRGLLGGERS